MLKVALLLGVSVAGIILVPGEALAQGEICRRGDEVRTIEILAPGTVGKVCDVRVTRDGGAQVNTPYHANADRNFCRAMAAELASQLTSEGYECSTAVTSAVEASLAGGDAPVDPIEGKLVELSLDQQAEQLGLSGAPAAKAPAAPAAAPLAMAPIADPPKVPQSAPDPTPGPAPAVVADAARSIEDILAPGEPATTPVILTEGAHPAAERAPRPNKNGAGRIVGVQPSLEDIIDVSVAANEAATPVAASAGALPQRTAEDVVKGVLAANAAAWNEGNLAAFLNGYDQSAEVRLVNGPEIVTGINGVRKHYQTLVQGAGAMGRLSFSDLNVSMTAPQVATVVGRYAHESGPVKATGALTMVMKQVDGRWRIVQDTRIRDADVPTLAPVN
jgi:ketosteroid isomerase-like protein